jgi:predicted DCC family thiol-disulfide oxidoreductase YuxK
MNATQINATQINATKTIVFDGVCVLCSAWIGFVIKHDRAREFQFAAMQTVVGRTLLTQHGIDPNDPVTFLLIDTNVAYTDTDAVLRVVSRFGPAWRIFASIFRTIPRSLRNVLYRWIARNRYRLFGRRDACLIPPTDAVDRFLK